MIAKLIELLVDKDEDRREWVEVVWLGLPPLEILDHF